MRIKYLEFEVIGEWGIEKRINEELEGWNITRIIYINIEKRHSSVSITLIGEIDE